MFRKLKSVVVFLKITTLILYLKTFNRGKMIAVALFTNKTVFCISVNVVY